MVAVLAVVDVAEMVDRTRDGPGRLDPEAALAVAAHRRYLEDFHLVDAGTRAASVFQFERPAVFEVDL